MASADITKIKWKSIGKWKNSFLVNNLKLRGVQSEYFRKAAGMEWAFSNILIISDEIFYGKDELKGFNELLEAHYSRGLEFFHNYAGRAAELSTELRKYAESIATKECSTLDNKELASLFEEYISRFYNMMPFLDVMVFVQEFLEAKLRTEMKGIEQDTLKLNLVLADILTPHKETVVEKERDCLLEIARSIENPAEFEKGNIGSNTLEKIRTHREKYCWMGIFFFLNTPHDEKYYIERIKELLHADEKKPKTKTHSLESLNLNPGTKQLVLLLRKYATLGIERIAEINRSIYFTRNLFNVISSKLGITYNQLVFMNEQEIRSLLSAGKNADRELISARQKDYGLSLIHGKLENLSEIELEQIKQEDFVSGFGDVSVLKGMVACRGKAAGTAKVVMHSGMLEKVQKGDILVAPETTVDYELAMGKAKAIVTEKGGITCHAAIISRELGIPCIVGTAIATKVFKDGDFLEVDAEKGVVRRRAK